MLTTKSIDIYGVSSDLGLKKNGSRLAPKVYQLLGLEETIARLGYNVKYHDIPIPSEHESNMRKGTQVDLIAKLCNNLANATQKSLDEGRFPLVLGGDHSIAIGSVSGVSRYMRKQNQEIGLIWLDAHADMNTPETTESGNIHGMPVSALLGIGHKDLINICGSGSAVHASNTALIGIRSVDKEEKKLCASSGVNYYSSEDLKTRGANNLIGEVIEKVTKETQGIHLSVDIDWLDPSIAPGVSTPSLKGASHDEAFAVLELIAKNTNILSMDFVELNPLMDHRSKTAKLACSLIEKILQ